MFLKITFLLQIQSVQSNVLYTKAEEDLLGSIKSDSESTLETFELLLKNNPSSFYSGRTAKSIHSHWHLLKQYYLLPDQNKLPLNKDGVSEDFSIAESSVSVFYHFL